MPPPAMMNRLSPLGSVGPGLRPLQAEGRRSRVSFMPNGSSSSVRTSSSNGRFAATSATRAATLKPIVQ